MALWYAREIYWLQYLRGLARYVFARILATVKIPVSIVGILGKREMSVGSVFFRFITQLSAWLLHTTDTSLGLDQQKIQTKNTDFGEEMTKSLINAMKVKFEKGTSWVDALRSLITRIMCFLNPFLSFSLEGDFF